MRQIIATIAAALLFAGAVSALPGVIQTTDGNTHDAVNIDSDTVFALNWQVQRNRPGQRFRPWEIADVRFRGQGLDEFNRQSRRLAAGLPRMGPEMVQDADSYLRGTAPSGVGAADWRAIQLASRYFRAQGYRIAEDYAAAATAFEEYFREAEQQPVTITGVPPIAFTSPVTGQQVQNAAGLQRYYLDAMEVYAHCLMQADRLEDARDKAIKGLQALTAELARRTAEGRYHDWTIRAYRTLARHAESTGKYDEARKAYEEIRLVAITQGGGRVTRASMEAQLKMGFMMVKGGSLQQARNQFDVQSWEAAHNTRRLGEPRNWISVDQAYLAAGSYVGLGMVAAAGARDSAGWSQALQNFSAALAIFQSDDEIRGMALLGAAEASAKLAELSKANKTASVNHARLAEKYLAELLNLLPRTPAAEDESIPEINKLIEAHR